MNSTTQGVLTLIAPKAIEEDLVDFFLDSEHQHGFTSLKVDGHSSHHADMTLIEQVTGRKQQAKFQILLSESEAREVCKRLEREFAGSGMKYWFLVSSLQGHIA